MPVIAIPEMCNILKQLGIRSSEYTDCTILYNVTFEQLRLVYEEGKKYSKFKAMTDQEYLDDKGA